MCMCVACVYVCVYACMYACGSVCVCVRYGYELILMKGNFSEIRGGFCLIYFLHWSLCLLTFCFVFRYYFVLQYHINCEFHLLRNTDPTS